MSSARRLAVRVAATAALGVTIAGAAVVPASAGVITKPVAGIQPTYMDCMDVAGREARRQHADHYECYPQSGGYKGYLFWYT